MSVDVTAVPFFPGAPFFGLKFMSIIFKKNTIMQKFRENRKLPWLRRDPKLFCKDSKITCYDIFNCLIFPPYFFSSFIWWRRCRSPCCSLAERYVNMIKNHFSWFEKYVSVHILLEFSPCEDELEAFRQGIEWDPVQNAREKYEAARRYFLL